MSGNISGKHVETYRRSQRTGAPVAFSSDLDNTSSIGFPPSPALQLLRSVPSEHLSQGRLREGLRESLVEAMELWAPLGLAGAVSLSLNPGPGPKSPPADFCLCRGFVEINRVSQG